MKNNSQGALVINLSRQSDIFAPWQSHQVQLLWTLSLFFVKNIIFPLLHFLSKRKWKKRRKKMKKKNKTLVCLVSNKTDFCSLLVVIFAKETMDICFWNIGKAINIVALRRIKAAAKLQTSVTKPLPCILRILQIIKKFCWCIYHKTFCLDLEACFDKSDEVFTKKQLWIFWSTHIDYFFSVLKAFVRIKMW